MWGGADIQIGRKKRGVPSGNAKGEFQPFHKFILQPLLVRKQVTPEKLGFLLFLDDTYFLRLIKTMDFTIYKKNKDILIIGNSFNTEQNWKTRKLKSLNKNKEKKKRKREEFTSLSQSFSSSSS